MTDTPAQPAADVTQQPPASKPAPPPPPTMQVDEAIISPTLTAGAQRPRPKN